MVPSEPQLTVVEPLMKLHPEEVSHLISQVVPPGITPVDGHVLYVHVGSMSINLHTEARYRMERQPRASLPGLVPLEE